MKKSALLLTLVLCSFLVLFNACKKSDDKPHAPYKEQITGVSFRMIDASPAGSIGTPDIKTKDNLAEIIVYPNPCINQINVRASASPGFKKQKINFRLVSAIYKDAPPDALVDNISLAGIVVAEGTSELEAGKYINFQMNVEQLPRGFYRLYMDTEDGNQYWDNVWITR
jgi:hypothetical protein